MRKILTNLKENWIQYGFDTIVVTVGILGAFALNSWYEVNKKEKIENKLLYEIVSGLNQDIQTLNTNIALHKGGARACQVIHESIAEDRLYNDSLANYFAMTHNYTVFSPNNGAYESLKSLGLEIIQNDEIRLESVKLYEQNYITFQENIRDFTEQVLAVKMNINPSLFVEFNLFDVNNIAIKKGSYGGRMVPTNFEELKMNQVYQYHLRSLHRGHEYLVGFNNLTKRNIESLIDLIMDEIRK